MNNTEIRYLGDVGSYSYEVAIQFLEKIDELAILNSYNTITSLVKEATKYKTSFLVIPLENTSSGNVYEAYNTLFENNFEIVDSIKLSIEHALIVKKGCDIKNVKNVYSHPQALQQVSNFISKHNFIPIPDFSTIAAVKRVSESCNDIGAIASPLVTKYYSNTDAIKIKINNFSDNYTRFIICKKQDNSHKYQVSIKHEKICRIFIRFEFYKDKSGNLNEVLNLLFSYKINLNKINSHLIENKEFEYFFTIEALTNNLSSDQHVELCLKLKEITKRYCYSTY